MVNRRAKVNATRNSATQADTPLPACGSWAEALLLPLRARARDASRFPHPAPDSTSAPPASCPTMARTRTPHPVVARPVDEGLRRSEIAGGVGTVRSALWHIVAVFSGSGAVSCDCRGRSSGSTPVAPDGGALDDLPRREVAAVKFSMTEV